MGYVYCKQQPTLTNGVKHKSVSVHRAFNRLTQKNKRFLRSLGLTVLQ